MHLIPSIAPARTLGGGGILPGKFFEKIGYLRQHFVRFEDGLLGNKAGKTEGN